jgi:hypothetical protein
MFVAYYDSVFSQSDPSDAPFSGSSAADLLCEEHSSSAEWEYYALHKAQMHDASSFVKVDNS